MKVFDIIFAIELLHTKRYIRVELAYDCELHALYVHGTPSTHSSVDGIVICMYYVVVWQAGS